jgi:hypothetical protein
MVEKVEMLQASRSEITFGTGRVKAEWSLMKPQGELDRHVVEEIDEHHRVLYSCKKMSMLSAPRQNMVR